MCWICSNYTECVEYEIETEVKKGKLSYGEIFKTTILQAWLYIHLSSHD